MIRCNSIRLNLIFTTFSLFFSSLLLLGNNKNKKIAHYIWMVTSSPYMHQLISRTVNLNQGLSSVFLMQQSLLKSMMVPWISKQKIPVKALDKFQLKLTGYFWFFFLFLLKKNFNIRTRYQSLTEVYCKAVLQKWLGEATLELYLSAYYHKDWW